MLFSVVPKASAISDNGCANQYRLMNMTRSSRRRAARNALICADSSPAASCSSREWAEIQSSSSDSETSNRLLRFSAEFARSFFKERLRTMRQI